MVPHRYHQGDLSPLETSSGGGGGWLRGPPEAALHTPRSHSSARVTELWPGAQISAQAGDEERRTEGPFFIPATPLDHLFPQWVPHRKSLPYWGQEEKQPGSLSWAWAPLTRVNTLPQLACAASLGPGLGQRCSISPELVCTTGLLNRPAATYQNQNRGLTSLQCSPPTHTHTLPASLGVKEKEGSWDSPLRKGQDSHLCRSWGCV